MHIAIFGNLIYDQLLTINEPLIPGESHPCQVSVAAGGLANFCRALPPYIDFSIATSIGTDAFGDYLDNYCECFSSDIEVSSNQTTVATVIVDRSTCSRTGFVQWGACAHRVNWEPHRKADWHHLMYLDRMRITPAQIARLPGKVSVDFCAVENIEDYLEFLPFIDVLIVSESNRRKLSTFKFPTKMGIIVHTPTVAYSKLNGVYKELMMTPEPDLNVVGAGDYFAALCVVDIMQHDNLSLSSVHDQTVALLRKRP